MKQTPSSLASHSRQQHAPPAAGLTLYTKNMCTSHVVPSFFCCALSVQCSEWSRPLLLSITRNTITKIGSLYLATNQALTGQIQWTDHCISGSAGQQLRARAVRQLGALPPTRSARSVLLMTQIHVGSASIDTGSPSCANLLGDGFFRHLFRGPLAGRSPAEQLRGCSRVATAAADRLDQDDRGGGIGQRTQRRQQVQLRRRNGCALRSWPSPV